MGAEWWAVYVIIGLLFYAFVFILGSKWVVPTICCDTCPFTPTCEEMREMLDDWPVPKEMR